MLYLILTISRTNITLQQITQQNRWNAWFCAWQKSLPHFCHPCTISRPNRGKLSYSGWVGILPSMLWTRVWWCCAHSSAVADYLAASWHRKWGYYQFSFLQFKPILYIGLYIYPCYIHTLHSNLFDDKIQSSMYRYGDNYMSYDG